LIENEKDMKFDFEKGKILLMEYFQSDLERGEIYTLQTIKGLDNIENICSEIDNFNHFRDTINLTTTKINRSKTLKGVFEALIDTDLEDDDETVLSFFIEGLK
jgi:dsDNA-specific endonuclease/ATPase MutS2